MACLSGAAVALLYLSLPVRGDGRMCALTPAGVVRDGKAVAWADVQVAAVNPAGRALPCPQAVRLVGGQVLRGRLLAVSARTVNFELGSDVAATALRVEIPREQVWALDFVADPPAGATEPGTLYRHKVEPLPGAVLWIDATQIAIDSPLGVLTVAREGTLRYAFGKPAPAALAPGQDEVRLLDGSILRGQAAPAEDGLILDHKLLGRLKLPAAGIRALRRRQVASLVYLADLTPQAQTRPLIAAPAKPDVSNAPACDGAAATAVRIGAETTVRYALPEDAAGGGTFRAVLAPAEGGRGEVTVKLTAGGKTLLEKRVAPGGAPEAVVAAVPATKELTIEVAFASRPLLPAAVVLEDPRVAAAAAP